MKPDGRGFEPPSPAKVCQICDKTGLSRLELAARLDVTDRTLRAWCSGETPVPYTAWLCLVMLI